VNCAAIRLDYHSIVFYPNESPQRGGIHASFRDFVKKTKRIFC
jgi:hypothetical protein